MRSAPSNGTLQCSHDCDGFGRELVAPRGDTQDHHAPVQRCGKQIEGKIAINCSVQLAPLYRAVQNDLGLRPACLGHLGVQIPHPSRPCSLGMKIRQDATDHGVAKHRAEASEERQNVSVETSVIFWHG